MRRLAWIGAALAASAVALVGGAGATAQARERPLFALNGSQDGRTFVRVDPLSLEPSSPAVALDSPATVLGLSPDGSMLAVGRRASDGVPELAFLDTRTMSWAGSVRVADGALTRAFWFGNGRLVVLGQRADGLRVVLVDVRTRRLLAVRRVRAAFLDSEVVAQAPSAALTLVRRLGEPLYGPARLLVVRASGAARIVDLPRIHAGAKRGSDRRLALVAEPTGRRAFVFGGPDEPAAEVDLRSLAVTYHRLAGIRARPRPTFTQRAAAWVRPGIVALVGSDHASGSVRSIGLRLVDTRTWRTRLIDRQGGFMWVADGTIVVQHPFGTIVAFGGNGALLFTLTTPDGGLPTVTGNGRFLYIGLLADGAIYRIERGRSLSVDRLLKPDLFELLAPG